MMNIQCSMLNCEMEHAGGYAPHIQHSTFIIEHWHHE